MIFLEILITRESYLRTRDVAPFTRETPLTDAFAWTHKWDRTMESGNKYNSDKIYYVPSTVVWVTRAIFAITGFLAF